MYECVCVCNCIRMNECIYVCMRMSVCVCVCAGKLDMYVIMYVCTCV